jgi:hypothetical protein
MFRSVSYSLWNRLASYNFQCSQGSIHWQLLPICISLPILESNQCPLLKNINTKTLQNDSYIINSIAFYHIKVWQVMVLETLI